MTEKISLNLTLEELEICSMGGKKTKELGLGIHGLTPEQKSETSKKGGTITSSQRWECTETGYITTSGPLSLYQRKRGIDTSKRVRIL